ncbi:MAG: polysaccharide deacetylase family protein [Acidaminococcaceae bacterium]|nr:polysaccharide deacetylase family protein [Acidaminococcaceae bacterium]MDD4721674.1 polysaccharide deacetylase family protein [Acidaminococcaceae bacterium]
MRVIWIVAAFTMLCLVFLAGGYFKKIKKSIALWGAMLCILAGSVFLLLAVLPGNTFYGNILYKGVTQKKVVALTFDDGPYPPYTERILAILKEKKVPATFFLVGENAREHPELVREEMAQGNLLGTHTYDHKDLLRLSGPAVRKELSKGVKIVEDITGKRPTFVRPPHGFKDFSVMKQIEKLHLQAVNWSVLPKDWTRPGVDVIVQRVVEGVKPGSIVLLHDGDSPAKTASRQQTVEALPIIIDKLREKGYTFVTVDKL